MANDGYEVYYLEKLWELVPGHHRDLDGPIETPGPLRSFLDLVARQVATLRRQTDQLWDDGFIELSDDWAVPYIGDLLGTRLVSSLNARANRISVAKTIHYRRRAGTPRVLEELISDIAEREGIATEGFRRLARSPHRLDPAPTPLLPEGGMADLRNLRALDAMDGPFDRFAYRPDLRRPGRPFEGPPAAGVARGLGGLSRAGIRKIGLHLYRLQVQVVDGADACLVQGARGFTFDPLGRDVALFQRSTRVSGGNQGLSGTGFPDWRVAEPWEVPAPMRCRMLGAADYMVSEQGLAALAGVAGMNAARLAMLHALRGQRIEGETGLTSAVRALPDHAFFLQASVLRALRAALLLADCAKAALLPHSVAVEETHGAALPRERIAAGVLEGWSATAPGFRLVISPDEGRLLFLGTAPSRAPLVTFATALNGPVGAGTFTRPEAAARTPSVMVQGGGDITNAQLPTVGVVEIIDNRTYAVLPAQTSVRNLTIQAADGRRPLLRRQVDWVFQSAQNNAELVLDGLWIAPNVAGITLRFRGSFRRIRLKHCTLDPGGAQTLDLAGPQLPVLRLVVAGEVDRLEIEHSIIASISTSGSGQIDRLVLRDSIVCAPPGAPAIVQNAGESIFERSTLLGEARLHRLYASDCLFDQEVRALDQQAGCCRYSAYRPASRLPHPYRSYEIASGAAPFRSRRFGDAGFAQLNSGAPQPLRMGAQNGTEMGAFNGLLEPIRLEGLRQKIDEYMPLGLVPHLIAET
jgi:hypothetical protein